MNALESLGMVFPKRSFGRWICCGLLVLAASTWAASSAWAFQTAKPAAESMPAVAPAAGAASEVPASSGTAEVLWWLLCVAGALTALYQAWAFFKWMNAQPPGDENMVRIASYVRQGAWAYLYQQYRVVFVFFIVTALILGVLAYLGTQHPLVPFAFFTGGFFSGLAGFFGMNTATLASNRTAQGAKMSLNQGLQVAFRSGSVMGLTVVGLGLLDITLWFGSLYWLVPMLGFEPMTLEQITVTMLCFGMGASSQALFARVGGGIFTKAADVGADLVGKVEANIPEDDPRNPAVIADNVGDNVGDVAGMGADLYESYCGSILSAAALGVAAFAGVPSMQIMSILLPMAIAGLGVIVSIVGIYAVKTEEGASQKNLLAALGRGVNVASVGVAVVAFVLVYLMLVLPSSSTDVARELANREFRGGTALLGVFGSVVCGLFAGVVIGWWTEYSTSQEYRPTRSIADQAATGPATVIIAGIAEGLYSVWVPVVVVSLAILLSFGLATGFDFRTPATFALGLYGVAVSAVGMLSTLGITLATDAYGPIADNAGGNAEMSHQEPTVRQRTDALDALGNTTAATGKGFAIGSAALTALALLAAYIEEVRVGLERWAHNAPAVAAAAADNDVQVRKLSSSVFAALDEKEKKNAAYLIFPVVSRARPDALHRFDETKVGETVNLPLKDLANEGYITSVKSATIPEFARYYDVTLTNPPVLVGLLLGVMATFVFSALSMKAVGRAAGGMVEEVRRQFRETPGLMEGKAEPDYARCVQISTKAAQTEMILPSVLALTFPIVVGLLLGVGGVIGLLAGGLAGGFSIAVMMANSGGAWDNAKKYIEGGAHGGKGTVAHKATVVGDTVGDPFKDTAGPSLNILIKLMSMVAVVVAGATVQYALQLF